MTEEEPYKLDVRAKSLQGLSSSWWYPATVLTPKTNCELNAQHRI